MDDLVKRPYIIGRPINGISINGLEFVLDDDDELMRFESVEYAKDYLSSFGIGEDEIEVMGIQIMEDTE